MPSRHLAGFLAVAMSLGSLTACGKSEPPPPVDDSRMGQTRGPANQDTSPQTGMSTTKKVVLLAGAAALYYMYKHHQAAQTGQAASGPESQYYLSKNGRVYYRDADHRAHWVTPPTEGVRIPESEAGDYRQFEGYDGNTTGRDLAGLSNDE